MQWMILMGDEPRARGRATSHFHAAAADIATSWMVYNAPHAPASGPDEAPA